MNTSRLNVRCCCQPKKILGTLPYYGSPYVATYNERLGSVLDTIGSSDEAVPVQQKTVRLEVSTFRSFGAVERAYKAEGVTIETLRKIPGFMESTSICSSCKDVRDDAGNFFGGRLCLCGSFRGSRSQPMAEFE